MFINGYSVRGKGKRLLAFMRKGEQTERRIVPKVGSTSYETYYMRTQRVYRVCMYSRHDYSEGGVQKVVHQKECAMWLRSTWSTQGIGHERALEKKRSNKENA